MHKKKIILIRHGEAASTWDGDDRDPGLSKKGVDQAKSINDFTKSIFSKGFDFISSPKKRAIETLNYASEGIDVDFDINESFVEIPVTKFLLSSEGSFLNFSQFIRVFLVKVFTVDLYDLLIKRFLSAICILFFADLLLATEGT